VTTALRISKENCGPGSLPLPLTIALGLLWGDGGAPCARALGLIERVYWLWQKGEHSTETGRETNPGGGPIKLEEKTTFVSLTVAACVTRWLFVARPRSHSDERHMRGR
jgi:hypothetical protein